MIQNASLRGRCIVTGTARMPGGISNGSLRFHIRNAKNNGVAAEEMAALPTHAAFYAGWPKAWAALRMAKDVYGGT